MNERKVYLDYLRIVCCFCVIIIHIFVTAKTDFPIHSTLEETLSQLIAKCLHFAVPIFFMITGYLFLSRNKEYEAIDFFKRYILKYVLAVFTFGFIFAIIEQIFNGNFDFLMPLRAFKNTLVGNTWNHMWYLYSLIGVMVFIPILKILLEKDQNYLRYVLGILIITSFIFPFINKIFNISIGFDLIIVSPYLAYAIIGYYLGEYFNNISNKLCFAGILICFFIICIFETLPILYDNLFLDKLAVFGDYDSIIILLLSSFIFIIFKNNNKNFKYNKIVSNIAIHSYGIYLVHMFWINIVYKFLRFNLYGRFLLLKAVGIFFIVFTFSYISTKFLKKIPLIKKIV